jgi:hypothetical protein
MKIIDDFLSKDEFEDLCKLVINNGNFPWFSGADGVAYMGDVSDKQFTHTFYANCCFNSSYFETLTPILNKIRPRALIRAKANLYTRNTKLIEHGKHTDFDYPHKAFILYLNTNNGYTRMPDGTVVDSVANRGVFFNGNEPHSSTNCTDELSRINIAINYF